MSVLEHFENISVIKSAEGKTSLASAKESSHQPFEKVSKHVDNGDLADNYILGLFKGF